MKQLLTSLFTLLLCLLLSQCLEGPESTFESNPLPSTQNQGGVSVGNPTDSPKKTVSYATAGLYFELSPKSSSSDKDVPGFCEPFHDGMTQSQRCKLTPSEYTLYIEKIELIECKNLHDKIVPCKQTGIPLNVSNKVVLYDGEPFELNLKMNEPIKIPVDLNPIEEQIQMGGIKLVVSSVESKLPGNNGRSYSSRFISPDLQGKSVRLCYATDSILNRDEIEEVCGNREAQTSDLLFDLNDDKIFSFFTDYKNIKENDHRPYRNYRFNLKSRYGFGNTASLLPTPPLVLGENISRIMGLYSPTLPLEQTILITPESGHLDFASLIHAGHIMQFIDGPIQSEFHTKEVCVKDAVGATCEGDDDPESTGIFDPAFDTQFMIRIPKYELKLKSLGTP